VYDGQILFANFIAQGCNIGLYNMADSTPDITYRQLFHVSQWHIRDDTLRKAIAEIIHPNCRPREWTAGVEMNRQEKGIERLQSVRQI